MKSVSLKMTMIISACMLLATVIVHAQDNWKQSLEGKWVFKSISSFDGDKQKPFNANRLGFEIPAEIDIQQEEVTFVHKNRVEKIKYDVIIRGNIFCFPYCTEWSITEDKLQLQWTQDASNSESGQLRIVITYSR